MRRFGLLLGTLAAVTAVVAVWLWRSWTPALPPAPVEDPFPLPPYSASAFRNTEPDAQYVGTGACAECHRPEHQSYLLTPHSRALADVDPKAEPADAAFDHKPSGRSYRVYRRNDRLRHQEVLRRATARRSRTSTWRSAT